MVSDQPMAQLAAVVDGLARESIETHSTSAIGDDLVALRRQIDRLEAQFVRRVGRFHRQKGALAECATSTVSWLRSTCGLTGDAASERVRMGRMLDELPRTAASFTAGRAPFSNVALIARLADTVGAPATVPFEPTLVTAAEQLDPGRMSRVTRYTRHCIDADGVLDQDNLNYQRRWFACDQTFDGGFVVRGQLDAEGGALLKTAIDAASKPAGPDDQRLGSQRRADALVDLAAAMLRSETLPAVHGQRPHLVVTASLATLQASAGAPPAILQGVGPINLQTARRLACDASLRVAVTGDEEGEAGAVGGDAGHALASASVEQVLAAAEGTVLDRSFSVGRARRTVPPAMRTSIGLRDGSCRYPGCDRPLPWTDAHHADHWADLGETEVPNLVSMCRFHHRVVHEQGRTVTLHADGAVTISPPGSRDPTRRRQ